MEAKIPPGFTLLSMTSLVRNKDISVIGVVYDHSAVTKTRKDEWMLVVNLCDATCPQNQGAGLKIRFFRKQKERLPCIRANGDVIMVRAFQMRMQDDQLLGMSNGRTSWVVFSAQTIPTSPKDWQSVTQFTKSGLQVPLTEEEIRYAIVVCNNEDRSDFKPPPRSADNVQQNGSGEVSGGQTVKREKFHLIEELTQPPDKRKGLYVELTGEVRRVFQDDYKVEIRLTDYTVNELLYDHSYRPVNDADDDGGIDGDEHGYLSSKQDLKWHGPWGQMCLSVTLWDAQGSPFRLKDKLGSFVHLRNVHILSGSNGKNLEGKVHEDRVNKSQIDVQFLSSKEAGTNERLAQLLRRKKAYEEDCKRKNIPFVRDFNAMPQKRKAEEAAHDSKSKKKQAKGKGKKAKTAKEQIETGKEAQANDKPSSTKLNGNIRCNKVEVPLTTIDNIVDAQQLRRQTSEKKEYLLPFQNSKYHAKVRVVDFFPDNVADFASPWQEDQYAELSDSDAEETNEFDGDISSINNENIRWEWNFCLLVEDATSSATKKEPKKRMKLLVSDTDGDYLLRMDACNLRRDPHELEKLKEKLFVLWGDLQERKEEAKETTVHLGQKVSSVPFECCIKEFGALRLREDTATDSRSALEMYDRNFRLWGTTIH